MEISFNFSDKIDPVAIYAAVIASAVLIWDIVKWLRSGVRLRGYAQANMITVGMGYLDGKTYVNVNVDNVGDRPTTIQVVGLHGYASIWDQIRKKRNRNAVFNSGFQENYPIPYRLDVGGNFRASVLQDEDLEEWSREQRLYAEVAHSAGRSLILRVSPIDPTPPEKQ